VGRYFHFLWEVSLADKNLIKFPGAPFSQCTIGVLQILLVVKILPMNTLDNLMMVLSNLMMLGNMRVMANNQAESSIPFASIFGSTADDYSASLHSMSYNNSTFNANITDNCGNDQAIDIENAQDMFNLRCTACGCRIEYSSIISYIKNAVVTPRISFSVGSTSHHELVLRLIEKIITLQNSADFFLFSLDCGLADSSNFINKLASYCKHYTKDGCTEDDDSSIRNTEDNDVSNTRNKYGAVKELASTLERMISHREFVSNQDFSFNSFLSIDIKRAFLFYCININADLSRPDVVGCSPNDLSGAMWTLIKDHREQITKDFIQAKLILLLGNTSVDIIASISLYRQAFLQTIDSVGEIVKRSTSYICRRIPSSDCPHMQRLKIINFILDDSSMNDGNSINVVCREYLSVSKKLQLSKIKDLVGEVSAILNILGSGNPGNTDLAVKKFNLTLQVLSEMYTAGFAITDMANLIESASNSEYLACFRRALEAKLTAVLRKDSLMSNAMGIDAGNLLDKGKIYSLIFHFSQPSIYSLPDAQQSQAIAAAMNSYTIFESIFKIVSNPTSRVVIAFELFNTRVAVPEFHEFFVQKISSRIAYPDPQHDDSPCMQYMLGNLLYVVTLIEADPQIDPTNSLVTKYLTTYKDCCIRFQNEILRVVDMPFRDDVTIHFLYALNYHLKMLVLDRQIPFGMEACAFPLDTSLANAGARMASLGRFMNQTTNRWVREQVKKAIKGILRYSVSNSEAITNSAITLDEYRNDAGRDYVPTILNGTIQALLAGGVKPTEIHRCAMATDDSYDPILLSAYFLQMIFNQFPGKSIVGFPEVLPQHPARQDQNTAADDDGMKAALLWKLHETFDEFQTTLIKRLGVLETAKAVAALTVEFVRMFKDVTFYVDFNSLPREIRDRLAGILKTVMGHYLAVTGRLAEDPASTYQCLEALEEIYPVMECTLGKNKETSNF